MPDLYRTIIENRFLAATGDPSHEVVSFPFDPERLIPPITNILATGDFMFEVFLDIEWHVLHVGFDTLTNCLGFRARV